MWSVILLITCSTLQYTTCCGKYISAILRSGALDSGNIGFKSCPQHFFVYNGKFLNLLCLHSLFIYKMYVCQPWYLTD